MAQLSASKTLAQVRPADGVTARLTLTSGVSGRVTRPSRCQLRPPSVLVKNVTSEALGPFLPQVLGVVWAAQSCPVALSVAKTGAASLSTGVQRAPPSRLTTIRPGQRGWPRLPRQLSDVATPGLPAANWTRSTRLDRVAATPR